MDTFNEEISTSEGSPDQRVDLRDFTHERAQEDQSRALRAFIGRGKQYSVAHIVRQTDISETHLNEMKAGERTPSLAYQQRLVAALPPEYTERIFVRSGIAGVRRADGGLANSLQVNLEAARFVKMVSVHMLDGRIDHRELREQIPAILRLRSMCDGLITMAMQEGAI